MLKNEFLQDFDDTFYPAVFTEKYELIECLGAGEQSETLLVKERNSGKKYIAKCYPSEMMPLGQNEADILKKLSHTSFPQYIETISSDTMLCVIREYIEGLTLYELRQAQELTTQEIISLGTFLCDALTYLHTQIPPVIHRDLKPQNIILRSDGSVALIDFGISRIYHNDSDMDTHIVGTKHFASPEQYGFAQTDSRSDIFSLGVVLNFLITGSAKIDETLLPEGPLKKAVLGSTEFSPDDRYSNADKVKSILTDSSSLRRHKRKNAYITGGILCFLLLIAISTFLIIHNSSSFAEPLIEEAALTSLGKAPGYALTEEDCSKVESIWIIGDECYKDGKPSTRNCHCGTRTAPCTAN